MQYVHSAGWFIYFMADFTCALICSTGICCSIVVNCVQIFHIVTAHIVFHHITNHYVWSFLSFIGLLFVIFLKFSLIKHRGIACHSQLCFGF